MLPVHAAHTSNSTTPSVLQQQQTRFAAHTSLNVGVTGQHCGTGPAAWQSASCAAGQLPCLQCTNTQTLWLCLFCCAYLLA